jgi:hypothetical protein
MFVGSHLVRLTSLSFAILIAFALAASAEPPTIQSESAQPEFASLTESKAERPAYGLVIRIDKSALDPLTAKEIHRRGRVDRMVLGSHAVGESFTQGAISTVLISDRDGASFDLKFTGKTRTKTVSANGPALIYSHTDTSFVCTRPISFDPTQGFVAGATSIVADTTLTYDDFGSSRGGLGRRLISRVAEQRAGESHEEARRIAARDNEKELVAEFDKQVNAQLAEMNRKLNIVSYKDLLVGQGPAVQLAARSSSDCIYIGISKQGRSEQLTEIPPRRELVAPVEIWVHSTIVGAPVTKLLTLIENKAALPPASQLEFLAALSIPPPESGSLLDLAVCEGWVVLGLQNNGAENTETVTTGSPISDVTDLRDAN